MVWAVETVGLSRRFGSRVAVEDLTVQVRPGVVTGFLGPNGAGKTTTFGLLLGLLRPSAGQAAVLGLPPGDRRALAHVGALVEAPALYAHLTGRENLEITRLLRDLPRAETDRVLTLLDLARDAHRPVRAYSLGMRQRLGVAQALLGSPRLLMLDEPSNGLDPAGIQAMRELLRTLPREEGVSVLLSSHLLSEVEQVAEDLLVIHRGRLRYQGPLADLGTGHPTAFQVRVEHLDRALPLLEAGGYGFTCDERSLQVTAPPEAGPALAALLVEGGCGLQELAPQAANLEDRFLALLEAP
jgi:ABC-2 type transport system ATP-binding protein